MSILLSAVPVSANSISVVLDGKKLSFDQTPVMENNRVLVPLRGIFEQLDASVAWYPESGSIQAKKENVTIGLKIGEKNATRSVNGKETKISLDQPPIIRNGRTLVPLRFIAENLGVDVNWDSTNRTVRIVSSTIAAPSTSCKDAPSCSQLGDHFLRLLASSYPDYLFTIGEEAFFEENSYYPKDYYDLISYTVVQNRLGSHTYLDTSLPAEYRTLQQDRAYHAEIWKWITEVVPASARSNVKEFVLFTGETPMGLAGPDGYLKDWSLYMNISYIHNEPLFFSTLVHELAHVLTLNDKQIDYSIDEIDCFTYYVEEYGCSRENSYLFYFYEQFWDSIYDEWLRINGRESAQDRFYEKHQTSFVSHYASTNLEEDLAETFMYFILSPTPKGQTVAEKKVKVFHSEYEMTKLRAEILENLYEWYR